MSGERTQEREAAVDELLWLITKAGPFASPRERAANLLDAIDLPRQGPPGSTYAYLSTLAQARREVHAELADGSVCPCCGQLAKAYRRRLNSGMARALLLVYRAAPAGWAHVPSIAPEVGGDFAKLRHWELVREHDGTREDGGRLGDWAITGLGSAFIEGSATVQSHVTIYNNTVLGFDGELIGIRDALGRHFSYDELMRGV